jgi:thiamine-monophosphate kinase
MSPEFDLIRQYFTRPVSHTKLGVGDDAALVMPSAGMSLAISADMLVAGTHFFADTDPFLLGWKSLAVNLSDMAAMGAEPRWATLAIALPKVDTGWLSAFSEGFFSCAQAFNVDLIGGDTTRGPLCISVQIMGEVPLQQALRRDAAEAGDDIWVSGCLGNAALALHHLLGQHPISDADLQHTLPALLKPQPRVSLGLALREIAHACIDISDGLLADLGHILTQSGKGAELHFDRIPCSPVVQSHLDLPKVQSMVLAGGDDYELCFTAPAHHHDHIQRIGKQLNLQLTCIGKVTHAKPLVLLDAQGKPMQPEKSGFDHFQA